MLALRDLKVLERQTGAAVQDCAVLRTYYKQRRIVVVREGACVLVATGDSFLATRLCRLGFRLAHHNDGRSATRVRGQEV